MSVEKHVRSAVTGKFVPNQRAITSPRTTETERIHYPSKTKTAPVKVTVSASKKTR